MTRTWAFAVVAPLALTLSSACTERIALEPDGGPASRASDGSLSPPALDAACTARTLGAERVLPLVVLSLDRSLSMLTTRFGTGLRFDRSKQVLATIVAAYEDRVRFAYQEFPGRRGSCGAETCCAAPVAALDRAMLGTCDSVAAGCFETRSAPPTHQALALCDEFTRAAHPVSARVAVVTDQPPGCLASPLSRSEACEQARAHVRAMAARGVTTEIFALPHPFSGGDCLVSLAAEGGVLRQVPWTTVPDEASLKSRLSAFIAEATELPCEWSLVPAASAHDTLVVSLGGKTVPRSEQSGWSFVDKDRTRLRVPRDLCSAAAAAPALTVTAAACPSP